MMHDQTNQLKIDGLNFLLIGDILYIKQKTKDVLLDELKIINRIINERSITPLTENEMLNNNPTIEDEIDNIIKELGISPPTDLMPNMIEEKQFYKLWENLKNSTEIEKNEFLNREIRQYYIPQNAALQYIIRIHKQSHSGMLITIKQIKMLAYIEDLTNLIRQIISSCSFCAFMKPSRTGNNPLQQLPQATCPWEMFYIDAVSIDKKGTDFSEALVAVDIFSHFIIAKVVRTVNTETTISFIDQNINMFTRPRYITADNASYFNNKEIRDFCTSLNIKITYTEPYHPQANRAEKVYNQFCIIYDFTSFLGNTTQRNGNHTSKR